MTIELQFLVFFNADDTPINMPTQIESITDADAELESISNGACYHGIYKLGELKRIGYSDSDIESVMEDIE